MRKQFVTNLDERVIKRLKMSALEKGVNANDLIEALVCKAFNLSKDTVDDILAEYQEDKENMLNYLARSKA